MQGSDSAISKLKDLDVIVRSLATVLIVLLLAAKMYAQPSELVNKKIVFDHLPEKLGLSQSSINCVLQDSEGYLWIGTWSGLVRYDGYSSTIFYAENVPNRISSNKIISLFEDHEGYLWIGTHMGGLFKYDRHANVFTHYSNNLSNPKSLSNNNVWAILEDKEKNLWIATEYGLNLFDRATQTFKVFLHNNTSSTLTYNFITNLCLAQSGDLWISTEYGLNRLSYQSIKDKTYLFENFIYRSDKTSDELHNYIYQVDELVIDGVSSIWFCTKKGLKKLEGNVIHNYTYPSKPLSFSFFRSLYILDQKNPLILAGSEMGLSLFDPIESRFVNFVGNFDKEVNLTHNTVTYVTVDKGGVLWVGTKKGLNKFDTYSKEFQLYRTQSFDKTNSIITGIRPSTTEGYWVSTIGGGLFKFTNGQFQSYKILSQDHEDFTDFIQVLFADSKGNLWIGTAGAGVYKVNEREITSTSITRYKQFNRSPSALNDNYIMSFQEDNEGNIWVGTWSGGLNKIKPDGTITQFNNPILRKAPLVAMHFDYSGVLWVGTRGNGLYGVRERNGAVEVKHYLHDENNKKSLSNNFINAVYEDHAGGLWLGTEGGLDFFDRRSQAFNSYRIREGLANHVIVSILEDDNGKLWLGHWEGLTVIDPADSNFVKNYNTHDRVQGGFFYNNVCYRNPKGHLYFGGSNGINVIDPSLVSHNPVAPTLALTEFRIFNSPVLYGQELNGRVILQDALNKQKEIKLKHYENSISFEFAALDYAAPEKIRYAYKLEGFDKDWIYTTSSRRFANYTNLNGGNYTFKIKATNNDGVWNADHTTLSIKVLLPWWKTRWAFVTYVLVTLVVLYIFRKLVLMRAGLIHDLKLERFERENIEKLNRAKLQFFTNVSHEFRTPLTLILGPVQSLIDSGSGGKFVRDQLHIINNNAQRLLRLVNQLLDFRKAETGNLKLEVAEGNIVKFLKEIKLSFDALAEQLKIDFSFHSSSNVIQAYFDRDQFEKIIFNLLSNAFKHTPDGGKISMQVFENKESIIITVEDNGKGIKPEHFENIFQSFFSYDEDRHHTGTGIGLALVKSLVDAHQGTIAVESVENQFTRFTVKLKPGAAHFSEGDIKSEGADVEVMESYPALTKEVLLDQEANVTVPANGAQLQGLSKLLIVEDNPEVRAYIKSIFQGKYIVLEAEHGKEGLHLAQEEMPDLIISDVMMPIMDGIALCKQLKSNVKTSHVPVILLTARTSLIFKVEGLETGADDYVNKPFNPKILMLKVRNLIRTREMLRKAFKDNEVLTIEPKRVTLTSTDEQFITKVLDSIEKNMSNAEYSVEVLGEDVGMSRMQLYRKLKAITGQSANEFVRTIRLKRAAQLLEQNQLTVAEITYEVGFNDLQYFRECFKKMFGVTPTEYAHRAKDGSIIS